MLDRELEGLTVTTLTGLGSLTLTGVQSVPQYSLLSWKVIKNFAKSPSYLQYWVVPDAVPDVVDQVSTSECPRPVPGGSTKQISEGFQEVLRLAVAAHQQTSSDW